MPASDFLDGVLCSSLLTASLPIRAPAAALSGGKQRQAWVEPSASCDCWPCLARNTENRQADVAAGLLQRIGGIQRDGRPDQRPQPERDQQHPDRRPGERALASGSGRVHWTMPPPPAPPHRERAVPLYGDLPAHQILHRGRNCIPSLPPEFPGRDYPLPGFWRALGSGSERQKVGLGTPRRKKGAAQRPPPVMPDSRLRQGPFRRQSLWEWYELREDRNAIVDRVEIILPFLEVGGGTLDRLDQPD